MAQSSRLYIFFGPDHFSAREAVRELRQRLGVSDPNLVRLDGRTASPNEIAVASHTATFFAEPRLVIVEGVLARFAGRRPSRGRSRRGRVAEAAASELDRLIEIFSTLPDSTTLVLLEDEAPPGVLEALKGKADARSFSVKRGAEIRRWVEAQVKARGASIAGAALERLSEMVDGYHLGELAQEIDKLIAYTDGRRIEVDDIEEVGAGAVQHQTWDLTDAVIAGRADRALKVLQQMDEKQHPAQLLLSMLVRQYRQVFLAQALLKEGLSAPQIGERLGITHSFPLGKVIDQASRYPAQRLDQAYRRLLEADAAVKTGIMDIDTAIELLIVDLCEIGRAGRSRSGAEAGAPVRPRF